MTTAPDLAALVASRLCHDLVSPLGAIGNGVELLTLMQGDSPETALVQEAIGAAQGRLRLFRLAFGRARDDQVTPRDEVVAALRAISANGRIAATCEVMTPSLHRPRARRLALAALCAETALAWGGTMQASPDCVTISGKRLLIDPDVWKILEAAGPAFDALTPATVHFALLQDSGPVRVEVEQSTMTLHL